MASCDSFDLYTCEICLENMMEKKPRLLVCHHSFCSLCLKQLLKNDAIICPTCRKSTPVQNSNIDSLTANFMLEKFRAHLEKTQSQKIVVCQFCLADNAVLKCKDCSQVMCSECSQKHKLSKTFKDHEIYKLCDKHKEGMITNICLRCVQTACAKCVMTEHSDHEDDVKTYDDGMQKLGLEMSKYESDIENVIWSIKNWKKVNGNNLLRLNESIEIVKPIKTYYLQKAKEADQILKKLNDNILYAEEYEIIYDEKIKYCKNLDTQLQKQSIDLRNCNFENYIYMRNKRKTLLDSETVGIRKFDVHELKIIEPWTGKELSLFSESKGDYYLAHPVFQRNIFCPRNENWSSPYNISAASCDSVLISDWDKSQVTCVYSSDKEPLVIPAEQSVSHACVYQNMLYTAYEDYVSVRKLDNGDVGTETLYGLDTGDIFSISLSDNSSVFVLSRAESKIIKWDLNSNEVTDVVSDLKDPVNLSLIQREDAKIFLVTCWGTQSVDVYDFQWKKLFTIGEYGEEDGQLCDPWGTTYTEQGILVADISNDRICQFSFDGKFIRHILTSKDGIKSPRGLIFNSPFLWVTSDSPDGVKLFRLSHW